ncbi:MAG: FadR family transcriptional regulator [Planctomycetes bacterium]|nr:FadR family transcriptional regulator [Planctomycetota bacterium]
MSKTAPDKLSLRERKTRSELLADRLCSLIRRKRLGPGADLGTEAKLAEQFGVSRTVVREAIGQLRGLGIVTSRQGQGLRVARGNMIDTLGKVMAPFVADGKSWHAICHLRFVLEVGSIPLTVERATDEEIAHLRRLADEMLCLIRKRSGPREQIARDITKREIEFHQEIFEIAGGEIAGEIHGMLVEYFHEAYGHGPHSRPPVLKDMQDHMKLVDAIQQGEVGQAVVILSAHIQPMISVPVDEHG